MTTNTDSAGHQPDTKDGPDSPTPTKPGASADEQPAKLIRRAGGLVVVLCVLALVSVAVMAFGTGLNLDAAGYLTTVGIGGSFALLVAALADAMKTASGNEGWEVITKGGRLFAAWWTLIVSIASATPYL